MAEDERTDKSGHGHDGGWQHEEDKGKQDAQRVELETENVDSHRRHEKGGGQRPKADGAPDGVKEDVKEFFHGSRVSGREAGGEGAARRPPGKTATEGRKRDSNCIKNLFFGG